MSQSIRWGIVGPGNIAHRFAKAMAVVEDGELAAVASRDLDRARKFAAEYDIERCFDSYEALAQSPEVDTVYVATPHPFHLDGALPALAAGKAVLCEKPLTANAAQARQLVAAANAHKTFLMEAMWTRFLPIMGVVREWLDAGRIGEVQFVQAAFAFRCGGDPESRLMNPALAGGGLLDVGIYTLALGSWVFGAPPASAVGRAHVGATGVDEWAALAVSWPGGGIGSMVCGVRLAFPHGATIIGTEGRIEMPNFWRGTEATLIRGEEQTREERPFDATGFEYEIREANRCLHEGLADSPTMPLAESLALQETMDRLRADWGVRYPFEQ